MTTKRGAQRLLREAYRSCGYVRRPDLAKRAKAGSQVYKKGYEVRLVVERAEGIERLRAAVRVLGFRPGRPFPKHAKVVLPIYGRDAVEFFVEAR